MLEDYFKPFREAIIGEGTEIDTPYGTKKLIYADWTASGRLFKPIEDRIANEIGPYMGNTHTGTNLTGSLMSEAYSHAKHYIKAHVNAGKDDVIISGNSGMTGVVNKFQRILGLKIHEKFQQFINFQTNERPLVLVTHMEHHSNQTSWVETLADVRIIPSDSNGLVDLDGLKVLLEEYKERKIKIAAVTSYSNVTGVGTPYHDIAEIMHQHSGLCFVDFACSAPYIKIDMNPKQSERCLDAIYFSPHKFLGGPGSSGILVFKSKLYDNKVPDCIGGGTVQWTNPWGGHQYVQNIEQREDGGTPAILQTIRVALAIRLKEQMGVDKMNEREKEQAEIVWKGFDKLSNVKVLAGNLRNRLSVYSFYIENVHYNLIVRLLNDLFGIQTRGGCLCAGTYGHFLLQVDIDTSRVITDKIEHGDLTAKPGWIRMSTHPVMTDNEVSQIMDAVAYISQNYQTHEKDYKYIESLNEFVHKNTTGTSSSRANNWISKPLVNT